MNVRRVKERYILYLEKILQLYIMHRDYGLYSFARKILIDYILYARIVHLFLTNFCVESINFAI